MEALSAALAPLASSLEADGYSLAASQRGEAVEIRVSAGPLACADCLVPKAMMRAMVEATLAGSGLAGRPIEIHYPGE